MNQKLINIKKIRRKRKRSGGNKKKNRKRRNGDFKQNKKR